MITLGLSRLKPAAPTVDAPPSGLTWSRRARWSARCAAPARSCPRRRTSADLLLHGRPGRAFPRCSPARRSNPPPSSCEMSNPELARRCGRRGVAAQGRAGRGDQREGPPPARAGWISRPPPRASNPISTRPSSRRRRTRVSSRRPSSPTLTLEAVGGPLRGAEDAKRDREEAPRRVRRIGQGAARRRRKRRSSSCARSRSSRRARSRRFRCGPGSTGCSRT